MFYNEFNRLYTFYRENFRMNYKRIATLTLSFMVCANPVVVLASQTKVVSQSQPAPSRQMVRNSSSAQTKQGRSASPVRKKVKKSRARKIAKKLHNSNLLRAMVAAGVGTAGFIILCQQHLVPGFEVMPTNFSELRRAFDILWNGDIPEDKQLINLPPSDTRTPEESDKELNEYLQETLGMKEEANVDGNVNEDPNVNNTDEEVPTSVGVSSGGAAVVGVSVGVVLGVVLSFLKSGK